MNLPERRGFYEHRAEVQAWIARFAAEHGGGELAFVGLPTLSALMQNRGVERVKAQPIPARRRRRLAERPHSAALHGWSVAGSHLFISQTDNHDRSLGPVAELLGPRSAPATDPGALADRDLVEGALELADAVVADAAASGLELPVDPIVVYRSLLRAAGAISAARLTLDATAPDCVVIGVTHNNVQRALARTAGAAGVPSAYIPHAPLVANLRLADLPVDLALVRGPAEAELYARAGASSEGTIVIGSTAQTPGEPIASGPLDGRPVFALPTDDEWALERLAEVVHEALGDALIASPHPRADRERIAELVPAGWDLWNGPTSAAIAAGPTALIQASSGTGLEALAAGVPVIDVRFPGEPANYPYLEDPAIEVARSATELREAVAKARALTPGQRDMLRSFARSWVSASGPEAAQAAASALESLAAHGARAKPVWSAWG